MELQRLVLEREEHTLCSTIFKSVWDRKSAPTLEMWITAFRSVHFSPRRILCPILIRARVHASESEREDETME